MTSPKGLLELVTQAVWCHIRWGTEKFPNPPCYGKEASLVLTAEMDSSHLHVFLNIYSVHLKLSPKSFLLHGKKQRHLTDSLHHSKQASKTGLINCSLEVPTALGWEPMTSSADVCPSGIQWEEAHAGSCKGWGQPLNLAWGFQKRFTSLTTLIVFIPESRGDSTYLVKKQSTSSGEKASNMHKGLVLFDLSNSMWVQSPHRTSSKSGKDLPLWLLSKRQEWYWQHTSSLGN